MQVLDVKTIPIVQNTRTYVFVQLITDEGITGLGECGVCYGTGHTAQPALVEELKRFVVGQDPFNIESIWRSMYMGSFWAVGGGAVLNSAISAIEEALWDVVGKKLKTPVYNLLGGRCRSKIRVYANAWHALIPKNPDDLAEAASKVIKEDGFTAIKMYTFSAGRGRERELNSEQMKAILANVEAVRNAVGDDVDLMLDASCRLGINSAIKLGKKLERFNLFWFEEPLPMGNVKAYAKLASKVNIPIAAGERLCTRSGFRDYLNAGALDILQPDISNAGGILEVSKKIAAMADSYFVPLAPHNPLGPIGTAVAMQVAACTPNFLVQEFCPYEESMRDPEVLWKLIEPCYEADYWKRKDGYVEVSNKPGLGIELREEEIEKHISKMR